MQSLNFFPLNHNQISVIVLGEGEAEVENH